MNSKKLEILWETEQIKNVMIKFGRSLDTGDWLSYRSCFTSPLLVNFERLTGQPEIKVDPDKFTKFAELILSPCRRHHVFTNWDISVDDSRAQALVYMTSRHWKSTDIGQSSNAQYGWYHVNFDKQIDGNWLISRIKHDFQWVEGNGNLFDMTDSNLIAVMEEVFAPENYV